MVRWKSAIRSARSPAWAPRATNSSAVIPRKGPLPIRIDRHDNGSSVIRRSDDGRITLDPLSCLSIRMGSGPLRGITALEFVARGAQAGDLAERIADFQRTIRAFGFTASACTAWAGPDRQRATRLFFRDWPADWLDRYAA